MWAASGGIRRQPKILLRERGACSALKLRNSCHVTHLMRSSSCLLDSEVGSLRIMGMLSGLESEKKTSVQELYLCEQRGLLLVWRSTSSPTGAPASSEHVLGTKFLLNCNDLRHRYVGP